jgi:DNA-binding SARP family transcriptional activator
MGRLEIRLLGKSTISLDGQLLAIPTQKAKELLAYLVTYHTHAHPRTALAALLWGDSEEEKAKINLRKALSLLRKLLDSDSEKSPWLESSVGAVRFNPKAGKLWCDVSEFERLVTEGTNAKRPEVWEQALKLYGGSFLQGIYSDWVLLEADRLKTLYLEALEQLAELYHSQKEYAKAIQSWKRALIEIPWHEQAHFKLMTLYALTGDRGAALLQYDQYVEVVKKELKATPLPEIQALGERLREGVLPESVSAPAVELSADLPFVGRERELSILHGHWQSVLQGEGQAVLIEGEPGVGKTTLVQQFVASVRAQAQVLQGTCHALGSELPYQPLLQAMGAGIRSVSQATLSQIPALWQRELAPFVPELQERLGEIQPNPELSSREGKMRWFSAITIFLEAFARERPLLLFLDDLHGADEATLDYLGYLSGVQLHTLPILLIGTYRTEEMSPGSRLQEWVDRLGLMRAYRPLRLSRLAPVQTGQLVDEWLGARIQSDISQWLHQETEGNPLFVRELVCSLWRSGRLHQDSTGDWKLAISEIRSTQFPGTLLELIQVSLRRTPERERGLLGLAAVMGRAFTLSLLKTILRQPEEKLLDSLDTLYQAGLIIKYEEGYRFYHEMFRQLVYERLQADHRRLWHRQVGQALEALNPDRLDESSGELALHFERSGQLLKALHYAERAADYARRNHAYQTALGFYGRVRALAQATQTEREHLVRVHCCRAQIFHQLAQREEQEAELRAANALALQASHQERLRLRDLWADFYVGTGRYSQALQEGQIMLEEARAQDNRPEELRAHLQIGLAYLNLGEYRWALEHFGVTADLCRETSRVDHLGRTLTNMGIAHWYLGEHSRAIDLYQEAYDIALQTGDRMGQGRALTNLGIVHKNLGEFRKAAQGYEQAYRIWQEIGDRMAESNTLVNLGSLDLKQGEIHRAQEYLTRARDLSRQIENWQGLAIALNYLGYLYSDHYHEYREALRYEDEAMVLAERLGLKALMIHILSLSAKSCARLEQQAEALARSERALALLRECQGTQDPQLIYWNHYELLNLLGQADSEPARDALRSAYETLRKRAQAITDSRQRETYLAIPDHQQIVQAWQALQPKS